LASRSQPGVRETARHRGHADPVILATAAFCAQAAPVLMSALREWGRRIMRRPSTDDLETLWLYREIAASGLFDAAFYCARYPGTAATDSAALWHFVRLGMQKDYQPNSAFDPVWYRAQYRDVALAKQIPVLHYIRHGAREGRRPGPYSEGHPGPSTASSLAPTGQDHRELPAHEDDAIGDFAAFEKGCLFRPERRAPFSEGAIRAIGHMAARKRQFIRADSAVSAATEFSVLVPWVNASTEQLLRTVEGLQQSPKAIREILVLMTAPVSDDVVQALADRDARLRLIGPAADMATLVRQARDAVGCALVVWLAPGDRLCADYAEVMLKAAYGCPSPRVLNCGLLEAADGVDASDQDYATLSAIRLAPLQASWTEHFGSGELSGVMHDAALLQDLPQPETSTPLERLPWLVLVGLMQRAHSMSVPCLLVERSRGRPTVDGLNGRALPLEDVTASAIKGQSLAELLPESSFPELARMAAPRATPQLATSGRPATVIIPSYECADELALCMDALRAFSPANAQIIIVDNASGAETQRVLDRLETLDGIRIIRNTANLGFTHAVNQGLEQVAAGHDIVLLNNDAVVTPGWLAALQQVCVQEPSAGLVVPQQVLLPRSPTMRTHNPYCTLDRELDVNLSVHHDNILTPFATSGAGTMELVFAPFFCVLIPHDVYDALGPLDHLNGPHYRSDNLYCEAVRCILNRPVLHTSHAKVYHLLQRATRHLQSADSGLYEAMFRRNEWAGIVAHHKGDASDAE